MAVAAVDLWFPTGNSKDLLRLLSKAASPFFVFAKPKDRTADARL